MQQFAGQFEGKVVMITGAAGNLGRVVAQSFAMAGAALVLIDLKSADLDATQSWLETQVDRRINCRNIATNLTLPDSVSDIRRQVSSHFEHIDIMANIAGGFTMGPPLHETTDQDWNLMLDLNARSIFNCCRAIIPIMLTQGSGNIINISARAALVGQPRMAPYCAAKAAVITLTESLAAEHLHTGIRVNCIVPSILDTPQNRAAMPEADYTSWVPPLAIADVMLFLASHAARCITGAAIPVYGHA